MRDANRIDASQVRLRVFNGDDYFQFFTGIVSGPALRSSVHGSETLTLDQFKRGCALTLIAQVMELLRSGFEPLEDPTDAVELIIDPNQADRRGYLAADEPLAEGEVLGEWRG